MNITDEKFSAFKHYPSLINHYQTKQIDWWLEKYPELENEKFIIQEKLDGANFQVLITDTEIKYASRSAFLEEDDKFYGYKAAVEKIEIMLKHIQSFLRNSPYTNIRLFGELFGAKIQKRVSYHKETSIMFYDVMINNRLLSYADLYTFQQNLALLDLERYFIYPVQQPHTGSTGVFYARKPMSISLKEALDFCVEDFTTDFYDVPDFDPHKNKYIEGVVIKPINKTYMFYGHDIFYIKKKSERFADIDKSKKKNKVPKKPKEPIPDNILKLQSEYGKYITKNRLLDVFSKYGEIEKPDDMRKYIKYMVDDSKTDFEKDFEKELSTLNVKESKKVFSIANKLIIPLLKEEL